jgi:ubiquinone/menaquinone biosynthesis C-methylase UbiE
MEKTDTNKVCPAEKSWVLDNSIRKVFQNPKKILRPYINPGDKVLDFGCGPGFFTIPIAQLLEDSGTVYAADIQDGMLEKVKNKISATGLQNKIKLHKCEESSINLNDTVDFILAFYMIHEVVNQELIFLEFMQMLNPQGKLLIIEPDFHVPKTDFNNMLTKLENTGFKITERPKVLFSRAVLLQKTI